MAPLFRRCLGSASNGRFKRDPGPSDVSTIGTARMAGKRGQNYQFSMIESLNGSEVEFAKPGHTAPGSAEPQPPLISDDSIYV